MRLDECLQPKTNTSRSQSTSSSGETSYARPLVRDPLAFAIAWSQLVGKYGSIYSPQPAKLAERFNARIGWNLIETSIFWLLRTIVEI